MYVTHIIDVEENDQNLCIALKRKYKEDFVINEYNGKLALCWANEETQYDMNEDKNIILFVGGWFAAREFYK